MTTESVRTVNLGTVHLKVYVAKIKGTKHKTHFKSFFRNRKSLSLVAIVVIVFSLIMTAVVLNLAITRCWIERRKSRTLEEDEVQIVIVV